MPYERLIQTGRIKPYTAHQSEIQQLVQVADRDLKIAEKNLADSPDWAYSIAYNSVLQACRALMLSEGYRPRGGEQHATVVGFVQERLGPPHANQVHLFDQMRRKRHRVIYEVAALIAKKEAVQAVSFAKDFVATIKGMLTNIGEQGT